MAINEEKASTTVQIRIKIQISTIDGIGCRQDHLYKTQDIRSSVSIKRIVCLSLSLSLSVCLSVCLSVSMHSHSFQDTKFKLLTQVKNFQEQVVDGLTILRYHRGLENKGLITQKT